MIRDQIVFGVVDRKVRERLLRETDLTLEGAIRICQACELSQQHVKTFSETGDTAIGATVGAVSIQRGKRMLPRSDSRMLDCKHCGLKHMPKKCPAYGKICSACHGKNHFAKQCISKGKEDKTKRSTNTVEDADLSNTFFVGLVNCETEPDTRINAVVEDKWTVPLAINGTLVTLRLDTGTCRLKVTVKDKVHHLCFSVVAEAHESLLGDKACEDLGLVRRVYYINTDVNSPPDSVGDIVQSFADVFKGLGTLPFTYKIALKENAKPVVHAARRVPVPLKDKLKKELDRMTALGVIRKVEEPTDWVNSMVCVKKKSGDLRICMDPKDLNENIRREHYQIPKREEITCEMAGARYFTKLDSSQGFWQLKLDESSTKYCTFNTPFGRYCFLRLPFGIISASEIFHRAMEHIIEGLEGVRVYVDDIIIWGSTMQEHKERLIRVFERVRKYGLKLNKSKCQFGVQEIVFLGDKLSAQGVQPDQDKVKAILDMPRPTDKTGVLRIMGMVNFIGKFIPNLAANTSCIRELLHKEHEFEWTANHESEWAHLKRTLTTAPVLAFYDSSKRIKLSTDASKDGIGAVLLQAEETDHRPLVSIIKKNLNEMTPRIQRLMMTMQRYDCQLVYTPGKHKIIADALSRAPTGGMVSTTEEDIQTHINMVFTTLPVSDMKSKQIADETAQDIELQHVMKSMSSGWSVGSCPLFYHIRGELSVVRGVLLKQDKIVIPQKMRPEMLTRIHEGHLGIEKCK
ncbi:uncharacterized protein LOC109204242 [Oreochromis niloticus]|uniref:uncharacterized protein LOC109204242 n=1 Tax=Oreochromis niloticus TaxID=8128 RepID=UPI000DF15ED7|nr:uncharacterized protein LOC109204242 [Oreochromis niloticus]